MYKDEANLQRGNMTFQESNFDRYYIKLPSFPFKKTHLQQNQL